MQPLPRLTSERLASLPAGTRLKMGGHIVKLVGRGVFTNDAGITQNMVDYVDSRGVPGSFEEKIFLSTATEHLNAVMCEHCYELRHPNDCVVRNITNYMTSRQAHFCDDKGCAEKYFIKHPGRQKSSRRTRW
ncbi:hypothetical protein ACWYAI_19675 [Klebsiella quasipneumoniae]